MDGWEGGREGEKSDRKNCPLLSEKVRQAWNVEEGRQQLDNNPGQSWMREKGEGAKTRNI